MVRKYTNILNEALGEQVTHEAVVKSLLSFFSEEQIKEFVESELPDLVYEEEEDETLSFNTQEEYDDFIASNPPPQSYCLECGEDYEWFMHNCNGGNDYNEIHGCRSCDDTCGFCDD